MLLSACAVGPDFMRPATPAQDAATFHNSFDRIGQSADMNLWWERLGDPVLNDYADRLLRQNLSLTQASERIVQARTQTDTARGNFAPSLGASADAGRSFTPANGITTTQRTYANSYNAQLSASWEIDLFGRIRRGAEAAEANYQAARYDYEALTHSLIAELLNRRVSIAVNKDLLDLAQKNYINQKKIYNLVQNRYNLGVKGTSLADVYLVEENYRSVYAEVYKYERALMDDIYRLDILLGEMPGTTDPLSAPFDLVTPPLDVASCVPAQLLDRRPDLKAAELRSKTASANIGVAMADLYPSLNLGGAVGYRSASTGGIFSPQNMAGSLLASLTQRIFEGGKLRANIALKESQAREAVAVYADQVLNAVYEVETRLKADRDLTDEYHSIEKSLTALRKAEKLTQDRYLSGIATLQQYLDIQQRRYATEQRFKLKQQEKWATRSALYLALGGDWHAKGASNKTTLCR